MKKFKELSNVQSLKINENSKEILLKNDELSKDELLKIKGGGADATGGGFTVGRLGTG